MYFGFTWLEFCVTSFANLPSLWLQAKIQKHQAFEAEIAAHANTLEELDKSGYEMINGGHYASQNIQVRFPCRLLSALNSDILLLWCCLVTHLFTALFLTPCPFLHLFQSPTTCSFLHLCKAPLLGYFCTYINPHYLSISAPISTPTTCPFLHLFQAHCVHFCTCFNPHFSCSFLCTGNTGWATQTMGSAETQTNGERTEAAAGSTAHSVHPRMRRGHVLDQWQGQFRAYTCFK